MPESGSAATGGKRKIVIDDRKQHIRHLVKICRIGCIACEGCLQTIVKPVGSGGASDPLDQRATVGAKVTAYTAKILNNLWIVRIEHGVSL